MFFSAHLFFFWRRAPFEAKLFLGRLFLARAGCNFALSLRDSQASQAKQAIQPAYSYRHPDFLSLSQPIDPLEIHNGCGRYSQLCTYYRIPTRIMPDAACLSPGAHRVIGQWASAIPKLGYSDVGQFAGF